MSSDIETYLASVASLCGSGEEMCRRLASHGLRQAESFWRLYPEDANRFATELAMESNASYTMGAVRFGYHSQWASDVLAENGLSRADLFDLSRGTEVEGRIAGDPRLARYTLEAVMFERSSERVRQIRDSLKAEFNDIGRARILEFLSLPHDYPGPVFTRKNAIQALERQFTGCGLIAKKGARKGDVSYGADAVTGPVDFRIKLDGAPGFQSFFSCDIFVLPREDIEVSIAQEKCVVKADSLVCSLRPIIQGVGFYSMAQSRDDLLLSLYCYAKLIPLVVECCEGDRLDGD
ncbi:hypothetical protein [Dyella sp. 2RAB6]|uniref:hypothetical protein n=1 Tax=Dyella sp. 2RAB6 TaxID=3232992 RepID=UPI003F90DDF1